MTKDDIKGKIREFITETFLIGDESENFNDSDSFMATGIIDSTGVLEVTTFLESEFEITIEDEDMTPANLDSVNNLVDFVTRKAS